MAKTKIAEELKNPDQFLDFWTRAGHRTAAIVGPRKKPALAILVAAVVVMIGLFVTKKIDGDKRVSDSQVFSRIQLLATADLLAAEEDKTVAGEGDAEAAAAAKSSDDVRRFKTVAERQAAVLTEVDQFLASHSGSRLKPEALLLKGATLVQSAKFDEAIPAFKTALDAKLDNRLRFLANEGLVYAYEGKGDLDQAAKSADVLIADAAKFQGFYKDRGLYQKARLAERKGDKTGAVKMYTEILKTVGDSPLHDTIEARLALLEAK